MRLSGPLSIAAALAWWGCSGDALPGGRQVDPGHAGAGGEALPIGLEERPSNTTCLGPTPLQGNGVGLERAFPAISFTYPVFIAQAPGQPGWFYVLEHPGTVRRFAAADDVKTTELVLDIQGSVLWSDEMGLLGLAFHPDFQKNGVIFLSYSLDAPDRRTRISRFVSVDGGASIDPATELVLLEVPQPDTQHKGGMLAFGRDGYLYVSVGDGGGWGDPQGNGQNPRTLLAKILRIDPDGTAPYTIPADNPWADGRAGVPEMYAWGFRNPWRFSFDRDTGDLWVGDVGHGAREEIDRVRRGENFGWSVREGRTCFNADVCDTTGLVDPVLDYGHDEGEAITGGHVYRGPSLPELHGHYVFGDYITGRLWRMDTADPAPRKVLLEDTGLNISSFGEDLEGEIYALDYAGGGVYRLGSSASRWNPPALLSRTGCVDARDPTRPAAGLVPYDVNVPFWSDGADKRRWLALPDRTVATVDAEGHVVLPPGSVLVKEFRLDGKLVETRLLWRFTTGEWSGAAYRWNADGTEASLEAAGATVNVGRQVWRIPSSTDCLRCHTAAAGRSLGMEVQQLNRRLIYPAGKEGDQLATLAALGMLDLDADPRTLPALPSSPVGSDSDRARAWLHANCSQCHRPGGPGRGPLDARFGPAQRLGACGVRPTTGDLGVANALLIAPGDPARSVLLARVKLRGQDGEMPPLGSRVVDAGAVHLLSSWIDGMETCP